MKYFLVIVLISSVCYNASAQFIFTPKKPIETLQESPDKYEGTLLKDSIPFSAIRIIDSRYDTSIIGFYLDGFLALKDLSQPLALQHTIDKYYSNLYTAGKDTLIVQLEKLSIQDYISVDQNTRYTAGYMACKEYTGGNNIYVYYGSVDTLLKEEYANIARFDLHKHGKHTNYEFWDYYLLRLCDAMIKSTGINKNIIDDSTDKYYSIEAIKEQGLQKRKKPILTADSLKPGFYMNFSEFVNNNPSFLYINDTALHKLLEVMHYRVGKTISNEAPDTSYWGYCDSKNLYIRNGYNFYQLERKDAGFYIAPTLDAMRRNVNRAGWNLLSGLALLTVGIMDKSIELGGFSAIQPPEIPMIVIPMKGAYILGLQLDWDTGEITY